MTYSDYIIYVDESGDHGLDSINRDYPAFVLDFCIIRKDHYSDTVVPGIQTFKFKHFGHDIVILHEHEIRKKDAPFVFLADQEKRNDFMGGLEQLIGGADLTIIATAIDKVKLVKNRGTADNPYELAMTSCMECAHTFLEEQGQHGRTTHLVVERRGGQEDNELELAFRRIRDGANQIGEMPDFEIIFADKRTNSAELQMADLTARPIGRHVLDPSQPNRAWDIIEPKLYRGPTNDVAKWGLRTIP